MQTQKWMSNYKIEVTTNEELKVKFRIGYQQFCLQRQIPALYPELWVMVQKFLTAFPSSYLVERRFSAKQIC